MSEHFVIVAGYLNTKEKENIAIKLFEKLSRLKNIAICYVTHHKNIPNKILDKSNYIVYNKYNPIMNWDICDSHSRSFCCTLKSDKLEKTIYYPQPYHGFAHLISMCDGIALGVNKGYKTFSFMNYDVVDFCVEQLPHHITEIKKEKTDSIFYPFKIHSINATAGSTEFFTFNLKFAQALYPYSKYEKFKTIHDLVLERFVNLVCKKHGIKTLLVENTFSNNGTLGKISFDNEPNPTFFSPYAKIKEDGDIKELMMFPYKIEDTYYFSYFHKDIIKNIDFQVNNKSVDAESINRIKLPCQLKIFHNKKLVFDFTLTDERQFGYAE